jgi:hypothetical protein
MKFFAYLVIPLMLLAQAPAGSQASGPATSSLLQIRRIYVAQLTGGPAADSLRDLIISGLDSTKLFVLTDNPDRADAVLKGSADDHTFTDSFDSVENAGTRANGGKYNSGSTTFSKTGGAYGGIGADQSEAHHIRERKHEAYATVRLCNRDGDVLWSTTQESLGAKFRGASADVAMKIARQLTLDLDRARQTSASTR